jgi:tetratricopeptide (TPR) repeat protein
MKIFSPICLIAAVAISFGQFAYSQGNPEAAKLAREGAQAGRDQDWDKAVSLFRRATEIDRKNAPNLAAALQQRAAAYFAQQKFDLAMADFSEAIKLTPNDPNVYERRAYIEMQVRDYDEALADYSQAIKLRPNEVRYYLLRSYIYETKGDIKNSMADTDKVLELQPKNPEALARKQRLKTILQSQAAPPPPPGPIKNPAQPPPAPGKTP